MRPFATSSARYRCLTRIAYGFVDWRAILTDPIDILIHTTVPQNMKLLDHCMARMDALVWP